MLYEIKKVLPDISVVGLDISRYAIKKLEKRNQKNIFFHDLRKIKFKFKEFDLAISLATLHNLDLMSLELARDV